MNTKIDKNIFGNRLKSLMEKYHETTYSLGKVLNLSAPTISRYARGEMFPKMTTVDALARYFNVDSAWLAGLSDDIFKDETLENADSTTDITVFETIDYSLPIYSNKKTNRILTLPLELVSQWGAIIGFKINDDAMKPYINKDDIVIIRLGNVKLPNRYVALHINEEPLIIRKVRQVESQIILQPSNINYDAEVFNINRDNIQIIGNVVYIHHESNKIIEK